MFIEKGLQHMSIEQQLELILARTAYDKKLIETQSKLLDTLGEMLTVFITADIIVPKENNPELDAILNKAWEILGVCKKLKEHEATGDKDIASIPKVTVH